MVIAKTETAMQSLSRQFKDRTVRKQYVALIRGHIEPERGEIETLIGRSPHNRKKMSARVKSGRQAVTHYTTVERFAEAACLQVTIETGRTHQIRVHMAHLGHPILGDREYGRARSLADGTPIDRQMLHAARLSFTHPINGRPLEFEAPLPEDMRQLIQHLRA
jgi:23S rRNA pseudouridine1911/1915/1917 synthase